MPTGPTPASLAQGLRLTGQYHIANDTDPRPIAIELASDDTSVAADHLTLPIDGSMSMDEMERAIIRAALV